MRLWRDSIIKNCAILFEFCETELPAVIVQLRDKLIDTFSVCKQVSFGINTAKNIGRKTV